MRRRRHPRKSSLPPRDHRHPAVLRYTCLQSFKSRDSRLRRVATTSERTVGWCVKEGAILETTEQKNTQCARLGSIHTVHEIGAISTQSYFCLHIHFSRSARRVGRIANTSHTSPRIRTGFRTLIGVQDKGARGSCPEGVAQGCQQGERQEALGTYGRCPQRIGCVGLSLHHAT